MKKTFVLLFLAGILLVLSACDIGTSSALSPSERIIGAWIDDFDINHWTFTSDNAMWVTDAFTIDFKEAGEMPDVTVSDTETSTTYTIEMSDSSGTGTYTFETLTDTTLNFSVNTPGLIAGPILLTKQ